MRPGQRARGDDSTRSASALSVRKPSGPSFGKLAAVLDKTERQFFAGRDVDGVVRTIGQTLYAQGILLQQTGPQTWAGRGQFAQWGLVPKVSVYAAPSPQGFYLDVRVTADIEGSGIAMLIVCWFVFFPVALVLAYMAYQDFSQRQYTLHQSIWSPIAHLFVPPNYPPVFGAPGQPPQAPPQAPPPG